MNGSKDEIDKRKADRDRVVALAAEFQKSDPEMLAAAREMLEQLLTKRFYTAKGFAMAAQHPVAKIGFEVSFNFAPGSSKAVEVRDIVSCPPVTDTMRREIRIEGKG
jgi:hypothetical protein